MGERSPIKRFRVVCLPDAGIPSMIFLRDGNHESYPREDLILRFCIGSILS